MDHDHYTAEYVPPLVAALQAIAALNATEEAAALPPESRDAITAALEGWEQLAGLEKLEWKLATLANEIPVAGHLREHIHSVVLATQKAFFRATEHDEFGSIPKHIAALAAEAERYGFLPDALRQALRDGAEHWSGLARLGDALEMLRVWQPQDERQQEAADALLARLELLNTHAEFLPPMPPELSVQERFAALVASIMEHTPEALQRALYWFFVEPIGGHDHEHDHDHDHHDHDHEHDHEHEHEHGHACIPSEPGSIVSHAEGEGEEHGHETPSYTVWERQYTNNPLRDIFWPKVEAVTYYGQKPEHAGGHHHHHSHGPATRFGAFVSIFMVLVFAGSAAYIALSGARPPEGLGHGHGEGSSAHTQEAWPLLPPWAEHFNFPPGRGGR